MDIAGKTGTAQVNAPRQATSVFTSFAPASNPRFVVDAFIEDAGYGASVAAPVVREIYDGLFNLPLQPVTYTGAGSGRPELMLATKPAPGTVPRRQTPTIWQHLDPILIVATLLIGVFGCVMVYTVTRDPLQAAGLSPAYYLKKQAIFMVIGVVVMAAVTAIDYRRYRDWAPVIYGLSDPHAAGRLRGRATRAGAPRPGSRSAPTSWSRPSSPRSG